MHQPRAAQAPRTLDCSPNEQGQETSRMVETRIRLLTKQPPCQRTEATAQGRPASSPGSCIVLKLHLIASWCPCRRRSGALGFNSAATVLVPSAPLPGQTGHGAYATICRSFGHSVSLLCNRHP
ncbi:hypothetical protein FH063_006513 [Azospirillum argentinense]|uniref:Uncharacterized protein n=1 Tax=Azospirillum argentinense TaxID=2970906 RepID=A0A5B0KT47_9PROT|nr:hypothetical protein FH063_006513 [Azospirillum argentinense]